MALEVPSRQTHVTEPDAAEDDINDWYFGDTKSHFVDRAKCHAHHHTVTSLGFKRFGRISPRLVLVAVTVDEDDLNILG
jgi:hypothetical protein